MRRVVVTGMGAITPIGLSVEEFWKGIHAGQIGFGPITKFDASEYKAHLAAEVKGFVGKEHMDFKAAKRMELFAQYAVAAAKEAVADAGLDMEKRTLTVAVQPLDAVLEVFRQSSASIQRLWKRTGQSQSDFRSIDDLKHGSRKCLHPAGIAGKMYQ